MRIPPAAVLWGCLRLHMSCATAAITDISRPRGFSQCSEASTRVLSVGEGHKAAKKRVKEAKVANVDKVGVRASQGTED